MSHDVLATLQAATAAPNADRRAQGSAAAPIPGGTPSSGSEGQTRRPVVMKELRLPSELEAQQGLQQERQRRLREQLPGNLVPGAARAPQRRNSPPAGSAAAAGSNVEVSSEGRGGSLIASAGNGAGAKEPRGGSNGAPRSGPVAKPRPVAR